MPKKILVVDDERRIVRTIRVNLERAGYEVVTALDGKDALEKVTSEQPDLVVLDFMMPNMDGFEVLQNLRKNPNTKDLPVIMLMAKAQEADVFRGWQSGVDCYLTKPINPMELISFVKRIFKSLESEERFSLGWPGAQFDTPKPLVMRLQRLTRSSPLHCQWVLSGIPSSDQERYVKYHEKNRLDILYHPLEADPANAAIFEEVHRDAAALTEAYCQEQQREHEENGTYFSRMGMCHYHWGRMAELLRERYGLEWKSPAQMNPNSNFD